MVLISIIIYKINNVFNLGCKSNILLISGKKLAFGIFSTTVRESITGTTGS